MKILWVETCAYTYTCVDNVHEHKGIDILSYEQYFNIAELVRAFTVQINHLKRFSNMEILYEIYKECS